MAGWEFPPYHTGGLGVHSREITKEIARLGHRVIFLTPFAGPFEETPGVEIVTLSAEGDARGALPGAYSLSEIYGPRFETVIEEYNAWIGGLSRFPTADVIHAHDWFATVGARELARRLRVPYVVTIHSTELDRSLGHPNRSIYDRERYGIASADRVIAVSRHLAQQLVHDYAADAAKIRVIHNAVPEGAAANPRRRPELVLYLGRLTAMKGPTTFLRAAAQVAPAFPEARFVLAGEGPEFPHLVQLAARLGIGDRVMLLGKVSEAEREALLADAAVFVLPSVTEPFGIAALEAMAAGVPTIVSKTSGVSEVVKSSFAVDFWDVDEFASRISELLQYPTLRREMGLHGRQEATREGWPERAAQTVEVYREAIREAAGRR